MPLDPVNQAVIAGLYVCLLNIIPPPPLPLVHEWRKKWQLHLQLKDVASHNSILLDLQNVCDTIRMLAVTSIALLAEQQALSVLKLSPSSSSSSSEKQLVCVSGEMVEALIQRLEDATEHVRVPSAITLYCMDKQNEKVSYNCPLP